MQESVKVHFALGRVVDMHSVVMKKQLGLELQNFAKPLQINMQSVSNMEGVPRN